MKSGLSKFMLRLSDKEIHEKEPRNNNCQFFRPRMESSNLRNIGGNIADPYPESPKFSY